MNGMGEEAAQLVQRLHQGRLPKRGREQNLGVSNSDLDLFNPRKPSFTSSN